MRSVFEKAGIILTENQLKLFGEYYKLLIKYNSEFNLTAITSEKEVYIKHFTDSLLGAEFIEKGSLADVGSGGGFPGIPLKILKEDLDVTLIEATGKKCDFLNAVIKELNLDKIKVLCGRAEEIGLKKPFRETFDYVTARAVAKLNTLSEYALPLLKVGGKFICYKADVKEEASAAQNALSVLGGGIERIKEFDLYGNGRTVIVIKKEKNTPEIFPRRNAKIIKKPL